MDWRLKAGDHGGRIEELEERGDHVVIAFSWSDSEEKRHRWAHVVQLRDGKIVAITDYASPSRASLATRLRVAFGV